MNLVIRENVRIISIWIIYMATFFVTLYFIPIHIQNKVLLFLLFIIFVKNFRFIFIYCVAYILLVFDCHSILPLFSDYIFNHHFNTKHNLRSLKNKGPYIFVTNYPCPFYNYFITSLFPKNTILIGKNSKFFGVHLISNNHYILKNDKNFEEVQNFIKKAYENNNNVLLFIEETWTKKSLSHVGRLKTGIFKIAKNLSIPILPVSISIIYNHIGIPDKYSHSIQAHNPIIVNNIESSCDQVHKIFVNHIRKNL